MAHDIADVQGLTLLVTGVPSDAEALNNIQRHAGARHVRVSLGLTTSGASDEPRIELVISDDGQVADGGHGVGPWIRRR